ncbi:MAG: hypothetical protein Tp139SUR343261_7 [Prokaryotic dsDNA virus sp.]|jgi:hypothetical protein|nr:MAG: hypothetical protein Tp139SUR343261_7 [Prokaryotic dsDNA virus sp.]|tara:strand:+ start:171 stop:635 length:465 start_codon:yes stop_codon:yes gene_type:complete
MTNNAIIVSPADMKRLQKKMGKLKLLSSVGLSKEVAHTLLDITKKAVTKAPVAKKGKSGGTLRQSIRPTVQGLTGYVEASAEYAPYMEFGTGVAYSSSQLDALGIPTSYSAQFLGKGIREVNLEPRPFLFNSAREAFGAMLGRLNVKIRKELNK